MEFASVPYKSILSSSSILKPNYHLNYGKKRIEQALKNKKPFKPLGELAKAVYTGGIFKRVFVDDEKFGIPYISAQHMMNSNPLDVAKIISKKYTPRQEDMTLRTTQILVSCAGTVGNVRLIDSDLDGVIGSQDIIRIIADNNKSPFGYIYAYLASPTAYNYIQSYIYGSVVPRIEPSTLAKLPIPIIEESKQINIHKLISEASKFRVEANRFLSEAHSSFDEILFPKIRICNTTHKNAHDFAIFQSRIDAGYNIQYQHLTSIIENSGINFQYLDQYAAKIFIPNRGKRIYTKAGLKYLSTSDISNFNPTSAEKYLSKNTKGIDTLKVEKDWILIARSGQEILGSVFFVGKSLDDIGVNEHAIRLIVKDISPFYLFAFLSSKFGKKYLRSGIFGSAILTINDDFLRTIRIPILDSISQTRIITLTENYINLRDNAILKENQAIDLIEKEIESWQKS